VQESKDIPDSNIEKTEKHAIQSINQINSLVIQQSDVPNLKQANESSALDHHNNDENQICYCNDILCYCKESIPTNNLNSKFQEEAIDNYWFD